MHGTKAMSGQDASPFVGDRYITLVLIEDKNGMTSSELASWPPWHVVVWHRSHPVRYKSASLCLGHADMAYLNVDCL